MACRGGFEGVHGGGVGDHVVEEGRQKHGWERLCVCARVCVLMTCDGPVQTLRDAGAMRALVNKLI